MLSGEKACKSCRTRQELSNEYLLAKFGFDTAERPMLLSFRTPPVPSVFEDNPVYHFAGFPLETRRLPFPFVFGC